MVQFLWSYYLLWQFWFLARSKTMTWTGTARFFAVGAWLIAPLSALIIYFTHGLFAEGALSVRADWSSEVLGPFVEETVKLFPFFLLFLWTRRTQTFSLTDYLLAGAAVGVGFDFMEEMWRRWVTADSGSGLFGFLAELLSDTEQNWGVFTLFPAPLKAMRPSPPGMGSGAGLSPWRSDWGFICRNGGGGRLSSFRWRSSPGPCSTMGPGTLTVTGCRYPWSGCIC